jgi:hypothetical protein
MANVAMDSQAAADPAHEGSEQGRKRLAKPVEALLYGGLIVAELAWIGALALILLQIT